jgi:hypothetical protein
VTPSLATVPPVKSARGDVEQGSIVEPVARPVASPSPAVPQGRLADLRGLTEVAQATTYVLPDEEEPGVMLGVGVPKAP